MAKKRKKTSKKRAKKVRKKTVRKKKATRKVARKLKKPVRKKVVKKAVRKAKPKITVKKEFIMPTGKKVNMIVTYDPQHRATAESEIMNAFKQIKEEVKILQTEVEGLFKLQTGNARRVVGKLRILAEKQPEFFSATHHYTPIDSWTKSEVKEMQDTIKKFSNQIGNDERWRMTLNKRLWEKMEGTPLIIKLTDVINKPKVDLSNPQKIVQVEIIGKEAGISVLKPEELLDLPKMRE